MLSRQWVILALVALLLIPAMVRLGFWQWNRHEERVARNELIAASLAADPVPVDELTAPGRGPADGDRYRPVTATGTYDTRDEVVVRQRTGAGKRIGYHVLTPLVRADGTAVLVNRGWIPTGEDLTRFPDVPPAPTGEVTVTGRLMPDERTGEGVKEKEGLPPRQVMLIDSGRLARELDRPVLGGYLALAETSPEPSGEQPELLPEPDHNGIGAHLAYAFQWWLFAAAVPVGWVVLVRRELRDRAAEAERAGKGAGGGPGAGSGGGPRKDAERGGIGGHPVPSPTGPAPSALGTADRRAD
ncbi:SURF1 family protein [Streptomyces sp. TRM 70361]|uniref:SURF1 family cytochrome oxidase biogenesis protein n=1 Tax=Streptomyces sp. TRM 70361 TaxID=3116553 RepID=UPI002E7C4C60|nr:SURF1 family protein [Streptomyces sp. TRM 70361]MEE1941528.1 SURF1 family protein [Streptomyces sp. TRM 70361]